MKLFFIILFFSLSLHCVSQECKCPPETDHVRIVFYNLENFFDTYDDPLKNDDDYTPRGIKGWNKKKFKSKTSNIYKTILSLSESEPVPIIGIAEIENKLCINELLHNTPLKKVDYRYIHYDSPDKRGIDVALIYNPKVFTPLRHYPINATIDGDPPTLTRDILYVKGTLCSGDTLHFFVCHLPSRLEGQAASNYKRNFVCDIIYHNIDSVIKNNPNANIIVMGDMNDDPSDESISEHLCRNNLVQNISKDIISQQGIGTIKHNAFWNVFDQILVSNNLLLGKEITVADGTAYTGNLNFLLIKDKKFGGVKPLRTYNGAKYQAGYSDHLPTYIDLKTN